MSYSKEQPSLYQTQRSRNNQLINAIISTHDLQCGCKDPPSHLTHLLITNCHPSTFNNQEKQQLKEWLSTIGDPTTTTEEDAGLEEGELEKLFGDPDDGDEG